MESRYEEKQLRSSAEERGHGAAVLIDRLLALSLGVSFNNYVGSVLLTAEA